MHRVLFTIGPFTLYSYGFMVALGFLLSTLLILRNSRNFGISREDVLDAVIAVLAAGIIGGRLLFVGINFEYFLRHPVRIIFIHEGGLAIQGAIVAAALTGFFVAKHKRLSFWRGADLISPYIALAQALGRIGCFLNGCCYGRVATEGFWAVTFPGEEVSRLPVQIYSSAGLLFIFILLLLLRKKRPFDGYLFALYLLLYSFFRFFMDFLRGDELVGWGMLTLSQLISIGMFAAGGAILLFLWRSSKRTETTDPSHNE
ncbi:MAG: prolipoprotein diacylglyceryl transferase [Candidatus Omnitrophica bacterium]|nr:prolipoprotein diacylglyceryl transferase [Candidatus Omnitrophota bacterium]